MKNFIIVLITVEIVRIIVYIIKNKTLTKETIIVSNLQLDKYTTKRYIMTPTELKFYRELRKITDKNEWSIFPQVNLERIIQVKDNNFSDRNRIKSRSIDYTIVNNENCKIICCIELDDYTHNTNKAKHNDHFKDEIFKQCNLPLHRIKVSNFYNIEQIEQIIKEEL